jgi:hypothetical protein
MKYMSRIMKARERYPLILLTLASLLFLSLRCKDFGEPPPEGSVRLSLDYVSCTEVWLKLAFADNNDPRGFVLLRDGAQFASGLLTKSDTLLVDTTVVAGHDYSYTAQRLNGSTAFDASTLDVRTLDSTSHAINWVVDTLGAQGVIRDVWVFSKDNAIAVGEIFLLDSMGQLDPARYNFARWNGVKWIVSRVPDYAPDLNAVFAFSETDVWVGSTAPYRWNGQQWTSYNVTGIFNGYVKGFWGTSSSNLIMVGTNGSIARFTGSPNGAGSWTQMASNTTVDLQDIFGLDAAHIWATGMTISDGHSVVLQWDGKQWTTLYDSNLQPLQSAYGYSSLWTSTETEIILAGQSVTRRFRINSRSFSEPIPTEETYTAYRIRGLAQNDIFTSCQGSELIHFNGIRGHLFTELKPLGNGHAYWYCVFPTGDFILVGGSLFNGLYDVPAVIRGNR